MASSSDMKDYVLENLREISQDCSEFRGIYWSARKMFGEYCIYAQSASFALSPSAEHEVEKKAVFLLCDNTLFIKQHKSLEELLYHHDKAPPFEGAKEWYVLDIDSKEILKEALILALPHIKPQKPKCTKKNE